MLTYVASTRVGGGEGSANLNKSKKQLLFDYNLKLQLFKLLSYYGVIPNDESAIGLKMINENKVFSILVVVLMC